MNEITLNWNEYTESAIKTACEGIVMIENKENVLPLKTGARVALFGRMQIHYYKSGTGSGGMVNVHHVTDIREGLNDCESVTLDAELMDIYDKWDAENPIDTGLGWGKEAWSQAEMPVSSELAEKLASRNDYAVIIIDISLPDGNGFALYGDIRRVNQAPVIFLTALDDEDSIVKGFDLGAEDYITKPFSTRELIARVKRLTRRSKSTVTVGEITLDLDKQAVFKGGEKVELTALEYRICSLLVQNHGAVVTREMIFEKIWDIAGNYVNDNTLSVYIRRIRQKLGTGQIKTVKGAGYRMEDV